MAPKKGSKKVSLNQFLSVAPTKGDWADDDFELPTAPAAKDPLFYGGGGGLDYAPDRKDRDYASWGSGSFAHDREREPRPDVPLPTAPPYTAFIGSMSFDSTDADLADFFDGQPVTSIRIVTEGFTGRSRGFGYVEFATLEALQEALGRTGGIISGRPVRISVAEPPRHAFSAADDTDQWRRSGPGSGLGSSRRSGYGEIADGSSGFDLMEVTGGVRAGFGSRFDPSAAAAGKRPSGFAGEFDPFAADDAANWRTGKPVEARHTTQHFPHVSVAPGEDVVIDRSTFGQKVTLSPPARTREDRGRAVGFAAHAGEDITIDRSAFGSKLPPPREATHGRRGGGFFERHSSEQGGTEEEPWRRAGPSAPALRKERPHLKLQPRSSTLPPVGAEAAHISGKPSPFGAARPVDSAERERQITERLQERRRVDAAARRAHKARSGTDASSHVGNVESEAGASSASHIQHDTRAGKARPKRGTEESAQRPLKPDSPYPPPLAPDTATDVAQRDLPQLSLAAQLGEVMLD